MPKLPDPDAPAFADVGFVSAIGSAVYFEASGTATLKPGDTFIFKSTSSDPASLAFTGEYTVASCVVTSGISTITTTCIGTANVIGI